MMPRATAVVLACASLAVWAPAMSVEAGQRPTEAPDGRQTIEFNGCVSLEPTATGEFTFVESRTGSAYRLHGKGVKKYAGRRVAIVPNAERRRLGFRFGLWPSPNVAAQAGAIDAVQAAVARQPGGEASITDPANLPELRVKGMRRIEGACE